MKDPAKMTNDELTVAYEKSSGYDKYIKDEMVRRFTYYSMHGDISQYDTAKDTWDRK